MEESSLWYVFAVIVVVLLAADLWINRKPHHIPFKSAVKQMSVWIGVALAFGVLLFIVTEDPTKTMEYYTAYAIEEAMSMDNLFVFIIIFAYFGIKDENQHHALFYGVVGAIVFRAIFIFAGVELLERFDWLLYVFGIVLLIVALKTTFEKDDEQKENGIANGDTRGDFKPEQFVTRQELAAFLTRYDAYRGSELAEGTLGLYSDAGEISAWAEESMAHAVGMGLLEGAGGKLSPTASATRAQLAVILQRLTTQAVG